MTKVIRKRRKKNTFFRKLYRHNPKLYYGFVATVTVLIIVLLVVVIKGIIGLFSGETIEPETVRVNPIPRPELNVDLLTSNEYSRPGIVLEEINGIVVHYTANPGTTAKQNRDYFEGLKDTKTTKVSSHFVIGLEGEIVQCIPCAEIAYASNERNADTVSIECCHEDASGKFNKETYDSLVQLVAWLCCEHDLDVEKQVIRHYDVTGKECPKYFVDYGTEWKQFKEDVETYIEKAER